MCSKHLKVSVLLGNFIFLLIFYYVFVLDFMRWKSQELEVQTGCTYERCFTNEYSRSIYYKCAAIRINRITLTGKQTTSSKEPASIEPGGSHHPSIPKNSNSNNATPTVNGNGDPNSAEKVSAPPPPAPPQGDMILESSFDARMYPCTSSIRLVFRYTGIEVCPTLLFDLSIRLKLIDYFIFYFIFIGN